MRRTPSQNVRFEAASVGDDPFEPPGLTIAVGIRDYLRRKGLAADDEDNWRDCGWSIDIRFPEITIQIVLVNTAEAHNWMAQIAPLKEPGFLAQLFGRPFVPREPEVLAVSQHIHRYLLESEYKAILWCLDGFPEIGNGFPEPINNASRTD